MGSHISPGAKCWGLATNNGEVIEMIEIGEWTKETLAQGKGCIGYVPFTTARADAKWLADGIPHEVWYTERNGDPLTLVVPEGTPESELPNWAKGYMVFEWIRPENEFGSGVRVFRR